MFILLWRIPLDFFAVCAAWFLGYFLRPYTDLIPGVQRVFPIENLPQLDFFLPFALWSALTFIILSAFLQHYRFSEEFEPVREGVRLLFAIFLWGMLIVAWYALFRHELIFSRIVLAQTMIFTWFFAILIRFFLRGVQLLQWHGERNRKNIFLFGSPAAIAIIMKVLASYPQFAICGSADENAILHERLALAGVDELWRCDPDLSEEAGTKIRKLAEEHHLTYRFIPRERAFSLQRFELMLLADIPFLVARLLPLTLWQRVTKRLFDIVFAILILMVLSPFFLLFAVFIFLDSRGSVFFLGKRMGRTGETFTLWKFRSMIPDADSQKKDLKDLSHRDGPFFKVKNDPRVTRFGRFLRRLSLDELPNFWNVLKGDMAVVGPRPHLPEEVGKYKPWQKRVLLMKPGVTGLAQVSGRSDLSFAEEVRLDLYYLENWSFWLDMKIILKTLAVIVSQKGAD